MAEERDTTPDYPVCYLAEEPDVASVMDSILRRLEMLEAKFTTTQGINELAHAIELRIVAKMRNTYGRDV